MKWMTKVNVKNRSYNKQFKDKKTDPNVYVKYLASDREMAARAHALLRELYKRNRSLFNDVIEFKLRIIRSSNNLFFPPDIFFIKHFFFVHNILLIRNEKFQ